MEGGLYLDRVMDKRFWQVNGFVVVFSLLFLVGTYIFHEMLYGIFGNQNYVAIHTIMSCFIVIISFTIAIQSWMIFPHNLSNYRLWIGALFFSVGFFEIMHTITYSGMPYFLSQSSPYKATWFYMVSRVTQALGLLFILIVKEKQVAPKYRWSAYLLALLYFFTWVFILYYPKELLPQLVIEGTGTTILKNSLQYIAIISQLLCVLLLFKSLKSRQIFGVMLIIASGYLIVSDSMFTSYKSVYDITNFVGHLFEIAGFYFLLRALYYTSVEEPFLKQKEAEEKLKYIAYHDELTSLPNLRFLKEKIDNELKQFPKKKKAVILLDIDRFKTINDSLGHTFGDIFLRSVGLRLRDNLPKAFFLSRMKGDEFAIFLDDIKNKHDIINVFDIVQEVLKQPFQIQHLQLNVQVNLGAAIFPDHGGNSSELLKHAQMAMYDSQKVVSRYNFYKSSMDQKLLERLLLENELHQALSKNELFVVYQPQVDLRSGQIFALEALVRWDHPTRGLVSPAEFIPMAEETGLIIPIGEWVLRTACKQTKKWHDNGFPHLGISVNLSTQQFFQQNLIETIEGILKDIELEPKYLELEITESMTMNVEHAKGILENLKKLGVKIAVDDFGTGYSSLHYLKGFPIDRLKIDQSFLRDIVDDNRDAAIVSMIVSMARHLQIEVIAEGVENIEQLHFLKEENCYQAQGFLFSPPIKSDELNEKISIIQKNALAYNAKSYS